MSAVEQDTPDVWASKPTKVRCEWRQDRDDASAFTTSCDEVFTLIDGDPESNSFHYCPFCGEFLQHTSHGAGVSGE